MPIKRREFDKVTRKFGFEIDETHHVFACLKFNGKTVVRTRRSKQSGDLPREHAIRQQLKLNKDQLAEAVRCTLGKDGYLEILRQKNVIPNQTEEEPSE